MDVGLTRPFSLRGHSRVRASPPLPESRGGPADQGALTALAGRVGGTAERLLTRLGAGAASRKRRVGGSWLGSEGRVSAAGPWGSLVPKPPWDWA